MLKKVIAVGALLILGGCASSDTDVANAMAKSRAASINSKAPYPKIDAYQIVRAQAKGHTVEITILYGGNSTISPTQAAKSAARSYCNNDELTPFFAQGVNYNIAIMDMQGRKLVQQPISEAYCKQQTL
ncbi:TPA: type II secretion system pilot lipoprotein GspS-beta [Photobacterium damselae]